MNSQSTKNVSVKSTLEKRIFSNRFKFKNHLISYAIEYIREVIDEDLDTNGEVIGQTLGVSRIPDKMLLIEMK